MPNDIANNMADTIHQLEKELKDLREENKVLISECDRLIKEKGELLSKVSGSDVLRICQLEKELEKAKRLLKAAVEDFETIESNLEYDEHCVIKTHSIRCDECPLSADTIYRCKWRYADEALALIREKGDTK